jgi:RNA 3'-terminal phosphate cyclase (ATP)
VIALINIDGSQGEGGGQIIRTALTLASITHKEVSIANIRAGRANPGLQPQHLMACKAVRNVCRGTIEGAEQGSRQLVFHPGDIVGGKYDFDIGTAGSVTLVAQALIPVLLGASKESEIRITGGTHVMKSPGYDYFENVFLPAIRMMGASVEGKIVRPGFYPKGGGRIELKVKPSKLIGKTEWPHDDHVQVIIRLADLPMLIALREKKIFVQNGIEHIRVYEDQGCGPGNSVTAWQGLWGAYALGERGKKSEVVGQEALDALIKEKNSVSDVDMHLADQLLVYAALAEGRTAYSTSEITEHLRTNTDIIAKFLDRKITIDGNKIQVD